jgi:hypothetical protein
MAKKDTHPLCEQGKCGGSKWELVAVSDYLVLPFGGFFGNQIHLELSGVRDLAERF